MKFIEELRFMWLNLPKRTLKTKRDEIRARLFWNPYCCYDPWNSNWDYWCELKWYLYKGKLFITSCKNLPSKQSDGEKT